MAWVQEAKIKARVINTSPINIKGLTAAIPDLKKTAIMKPDELYSQIKMSLADYGIALVFLPRLEGSFLQGATFLDGNKIVVGLAAEENDVDKFWFSLFHELAHVVLGHVEQINGISSQDEKAADEWAGNTLKST